MSQNGTKNQSDTMTALEMVFETEDYLVRLYRIKDYIDSKKNI